MLMNDMQNYDQNILSLFDPLRTPMTPERDAASPDPSSDKENDSPSGPAGPMTMLFNRVYKHVPHPMVKIPMGQLIDYDSTVVAHQVGYMEDEEEDEEEGGMMLDGLVNDRENHWVAEDDEMEIQDENFDEDTIQIPISRRQPLADIQLDAVLASVPEPDPIPVAGSPDSSMWDEGDTTVPATTAAPVGAPLASVINSINFAGLSLHSTEPSHEEVGQGGWDCAGTPATPEITIVGPEFSHGSPTICTPQRLFGTRLSPSASSSSLATRRLSPTTSATDPRRTSVDLQSSFRLQLQNAEMSFDLLNDKISFLGHDSFWTGTDDSCIDFEKEEEAMMAIAEECEVHASPQRPGMFQPPVSSSSISSSSLRSSRFCSPECSSAVSGIFGLCSIAAICRAPSEPAVNASGY